MSLTETQPIVLLMPARNEAPRIGDAVVRTPLEIGGHPVHVVVVDDDSSDTTASTAGSAGADVIYGEGTGLRAAVRLGLADAIARDAVVVAMCSADGEYDAAELERLVEPILVGDADHVVGSRFAGRIDRMGAHRRVGHRVATMAMRWFGRIRTTDAQSAFRAMSADAAAAAMTADHRDFGVLTVELAAKGFRYAEAPISYRARRSSKATVRLLPSTFRMVPAGLRSRTRRRNAVPSPQMTSV
jgi:glycosyltransferase involved in cell wall biosynthesis